VRDDDDNEEEEENTEEKEKEKGEEQEEKTTEEKKEEEKEEETEEVKEVDARPAPLAVEAMGAMALLPICDSSFTCEHYNTDRAHPWSPCPLRRAHIKRQPGFLATSRTMKAVVFPPPPPFKILEFPDNRDILRQPCLIS